MKGKERNLISIKWCGVETWSRLKLSRIGEIISILLNLKYENLFRVVASKFLVNKHLEWEEISEARWSHSDHLKGVPSSRAGPWQANPSVQLIRKSF